MKLTVPEYLRSRDHYYQKKMEREILFLIGLGFASALILMAGVIGIMKAVELGWIN